MNRTLSIIALLTAMLAGHHAMSQPDDLLSRSELVLRGGGMTYIGDLNNQSAFGQVNLAGGGGWRVRLDNRWSLRVEGAYGTLEADHDWLEKRNLSFRSRLTEGGVMAEFNFRPYGSGATDYQWTPYLFAGVALFHFDPQARYVDARGDTLWARLQPLCTEGQGTTAYPDRHPYPLTQVAMPFGMGVRLRLGKHVSLTAEYGFRRTWTDYLDDVSTTYVGSTLLQKEVNEGNLAAQLADRSTVPNQPGIKRGDDSLNDWYSYFNISIGVNMNTLFGWMRSKRCRN